MFDVSLGMARIGAVATSPSNEGRESSFSIETMVASGRLYPDRAHYGLRESDNSLRVRYEYVTSTTVANALAPVAVAPVCCCEHGQ